MTDYERGVNQASFIYQEVIRDYVAENARLRECLQEFADAIKNDDGFGVDQGWMLERMSEIGIRGQ